MAVKNRERERERERERDPEKVIAKQQRRKRNGPLLDPTFVNTAYFCMTLYV